MVQKNEQNELTHINVEKSFASSRLCEKKPRAKRINQFHPSNPWQKTKQSVKKYNTTNFNKYLIIYLQYWQTI